MLARFAARAFSRAGSSMPAAISTATTSPCGPTALPRGIVSRPGPQPKSNTVMPGWTSKRCRMPAARLVLVKGLSSSTSQPSHVGQGIERRRDARPHMPVARTTRTTKPGRTYAVADIFPPCATLCAPRSLVDDEIEMPPGRGVDLEDLEQLAAEIGERVLHAGGNVHHVVLADQVGLAFDRGGALPA